MMYFGKNRAIKVIDVKEIQRLFDALMVDYVHIPIICLSIVKVVIRKFFG